MEKSAFNWPVRVYYEDTDAGGVVYHSNYLNFMERARTEMLRSLGFDQDVLYRELKVLFVVRSLQLDYLRPARFNEQLFVTTRVENMARVSLDFQQMIYREPVPGETSQLLVRAAIKVACIDAGRFKPVAIPPVIQEALYGDY